VAPVCSASCGLGDRKSIHREAWPVVDPAFEDSVAEQVGEALIEIATAVRRYKSERNLSLGSELDRLQLAAAAGAASQPHEAGALTQALEAASDDLKSITRARQIDIGPAIEPGFEQLPAGQIIVGIPGKRQMTG
jgi:valyl-tRNA synthetase